MPAKTVFAALLRREIVKLAWAAMLAKTCEQGEHSQTGLHVRRGGFRIAGSTPTGEACFADTLARPLILSGIADAIASPAVSHKGLPLLLNHPKIRVAAADNEILKLMQMSLADILVTSGKSMFGTAAALFHKPRSFSIQIIILKQFGMATADDSKQQSISTKPTSHKKGSANVRSH